MKWYNLKRGMSRQEAKLVLKYMQEIIDVYGFVTLSDFYDLCGMKTKYTDNNYQWVSLENARVSLIRKNSRYRVKLPHPDYIHN